jgi:hypothetical protein
MAINKSYSTLLYTGKLRVDKEGGSLVPSKQGYDALHVILLSSSTHRTRAAQTSPKGLCQEHQS